MRIWKTVLAAAALMLGVTLTYSNHFHNAFQFDDHHTILENVYIRSLSNIPRFFTDATTFSSLPPNQSWHPLVSLSLALDYWLGKGYNVFYFHLSAFLWFLTLLLMLAPLLRSLLDRVEPAPANFWIAWFAAAWFGVHPAIAETVNYVIQRSDLMSTWGLVAGLLLFARYPAWRRSCLYLLPVALGLLAKAPALIFPAILAAYLYFFEEMAWPRILKQSIPSLVLTVLFLGLQSAATPKTFVASSVSASHYLITQPYVWFRYFVSFFLPLHLSADTDLQALDSPFSLEALGGFVFVAVLLFAIYAAAQRRASRPVAFGLSWFVLGLIPTSVFPLAEVENDHRMFLPFVGLVLAASWTGGRLIGSQILNRDVRRGILAAAACLLLLDAAGTRRRNEVWRTEGSLWEDVTLKSPRNGRGLMNYGLSKMSDGDYATALTYFQRALQYSPNYSLLEVNLGVDSAALGRDAEAEQHFQRAVQLTPGLSDSHFFYARWLKGKGRLEQAAGELRAALAASPTRMDARQLLLQTYAEEGAWADLKRLAQDSLKLSPEDPEIRRFAAMDPHAAPAPPRPQTGSPPVSGPVSAETLLSYSLEAYQARDFAGCIRFSEMALSVRPNYAEAYNNMTAAYNSLGQWDDAIRAGRQALRIKPGFELARNNLAWAESQKKQASSR